MSTSKTITRKDLKQDEFVDTVKLATGFLVKNARLIGVCIAGAIVIVATIFAYQAFRRSQDEKAAQALRLPIEYFFASLNTETSNGTTFTMDKQKYEAALPLFEEVETQYSGSKSAWIADYYAAICRLELGNHQESIAKLEDLRGNRSAQPVIRALAALKIAEAHQKAGDSELAIDQLNELVADTDLPFPLPAVLMQLGEVQFKAKRYEEARASFQRIKEEFGDSLFAQPSNEKIGVIDLEVKKLSVGQPEQPTTEEGQESR